MIFYLFLFIYYYFFEKQANTLFKLDRNFCPPVQVVSHRRVCHHTKPYSVSTWLALPICRQQH